MEDNSALQRTAKEWHSALVAVEIKEGQDFCP